MGLASLFQRVVGLLGVSFRRTYVRATQTAPGRTWLSVGGVALAVGLMVVVTGIGVGIATQSTVYSENVDYWITPETDGGSSALVDADSPQFGSVHPTAADLTAMDSIKYASPVLQQPIRLETDSGGAEYVLAVGIVGHPEFTEIADTMTAGLTPGDPYYANGTWTGEVVLSAGAAELLSASEGDRVNVTRPQAGSERNFSVVTVDPGTQSGSQFPIAVMQLSELQAITGGNVNDEAGQIVVSSTDPDIEPMLANIYPRSTVSTRAGLNAQAVFEEELPLALSVTSAIIAIVIGTLFVMTTTGLSVASDRGKIATLAAIGISRRTRFGLLASEILTITAVGGVVGVVLGAGGIRVTNIVAQQTLTSGDVASADPIVIGFGFVISGVIGLLVLPYLAVLLSRVGRAREVGR
ncbi:putative ABC transport system permease protein [Halohasta litchfieldiae]|uniref:Putative ABC transport system permease protein n=1 Tax=Halohasta litchfieldiae TaxID=1073996 RepID=A0A1H6XGF3_9EURY|nr:FtsX-like permease family protein [Halohasta litchfieldiae]ATW88307.1 putative ABC transport system permease protein [Halohasta litchfieldiae]SEJ27216.1 putative ABC transport system permease protein [Halohasta litchfieldiae]